MKKRSAAFSLFLCLLLAGCSNTTAAPEGGAAAEGETEAGYMVYDAAELATFALQYVDADYRSGTLWLLGGDALLCHDTAEKTTNTIPLDRSYELLAAAEGGVWLASGMELTKLGTEGQVISSLTLAEKPADLACDAEGTLYASLKKSVALVDAAGKQSEISMPEGFTPGPLCALGGQGAAVYASRLKNEQPPLLRLSAAERTAVPFEGEEPEFPRLFPGSGKGDYYCVKSSRYELLSEGKQVFHVSGGRVALVFDLAGLDAEGCLRAVYPADGGFLVLYSTADTVGLLRMERTERQKQLLSIARVETNGMLSLLIARFNSASRDSYLVSKFYEDEGGEQRLFLDLLAGERPDLLSLNGLTPEVFAAKGLLDNLYPRLEADESVSVEDLQPSVLLALESEDGGLYELCPSYTLSTCAIDSRYADEDGHMSLQELYACGEANPALTLYGKMQSLNFLLSCVFPDFADLEKGELCFDSPEFVRFLDFIRTMDDRALSFDGDYSYREGTVLLCPLALSRVEDYRKILQLDEMERLTITGYPSDSGAGCLITSPFQFGLLTGTGNEDAAWEFFRFMLSEAEQTDAALIPLRVSAIEAQLAAAAEDMPAHSETQYADPYAARAGTNMETKTVEVPAAKGLTEEEQAEFRRILNSVDGVYNDQMTNPCFSIVYEECKLLLMGERDAEATAKEIQSKMELYLAERN